MCAEVAGRNMLLGLAVAASVANGTVSLKK